MDWLERLRAKLKGSTLVWVVPLGLAAIIAAVIAVNVNWETPDSSPVTSSVDNCRQIQLGMTRDEVLKIMPEPVGRVSYTRNGREKEKLLFPSPATVSTPPQFIIDGPTGEVEEVVCDDEYRLSHAQ